MILGNTVTYTQTQKSDAWVQSTMGHVLISHKSKLTRQELLFFFFNFVVCAFITFFKRNLLSPEKE